MLPVMEKIWVLSTREVLLLLRSRARLLCTLAVPLAGGVVCGWMTRTTSLPPLYCLVVFLLLGAILFAADPAAGASKTLSAIAGRAVSTTAWTLAALAILLLQAAVLTTCASIIGGFQVSAGILAGVVAASLALSSVTHRVLS